RLGRVFSFNLDLLVNVIVLAGGPEINLAVQKQVQQYDDMLQISDLVHVNLSPIQSNDITDKDFEDVPSELTRTIKCNERHELRSDRLKQRFPNWGAWRKSRAA
ncbi:hypothetical protein HHI36_009339, partial [Cryptolaemus montrouzieri]